MPSGAQEHTSIYLYLPISVYRSIHIYTQNLSAACELSARPARSTQHPTTLRKCARSSLPVHPGRHGRLVCPGWPCRTGRPGCAGRPCRPDRLGRPDRLASLVAHAKSFCLLHTSFGTPSGLLRAAAAGWTAPTAIAVIPVPKLLSFAASFPPRRWSCMLARRAAVVLTSFPASRMAKSQSARVIPIASKSRDRKNERNRVRSCYSNMLTKFTKHEPNHAIKLHCSLHVEMYKSTLLCICTYRGFSPVA